MYSYTILQVADANGVTPLMHASEGTDGYAGITELLLEGGADPTATCQKGCLALHVSARFGGTNAVRTLLRRHPTRLLIAHCKATLLYSWQHMKGSGERCPTCYRLRSCTGRRLRRNRPKNALSWQPLCKHVCVDLLQTKCNQALARTRDTTGRSSTSCWTQGEKYSSENTSSAVACAASSS